MSFSSIAINGAALVMPTSLDFYHGKQIHVEHYNSLTLWIITVTFLRNGQLVSLCSVHVARIQRKHTQKIAPPFPTVIILIQWFDEWTCILIGQSGLALFPCRVQWVHWGRNATSVARELLCWETGIARAFEKRSNFKRHFLAYLKS